MKIKIYLLQIDGSLSQCYNSPQQEKGENKMADMSFDVVKERR